MLDGANRGAKVSLNFDSCDLLAPLSGETMVGSSLGCPSHGVGESDRQGEGATRRNWA